MTQVFTAQTANGNSSVVDHRGGKQEVIVNGTFNNCTVTLFASFDDGTTYVPVADGTWTSSAVKIFESVSPCKLRLTVTNAGASTSLNAWI